MALHRILIRSLVVLTVSYAFLSCVREEWETVPEGNGNECMYVIGDIQYYPLSAKGMSLYKRSLDWMQKHSGSRICSVLQTGDIAETNRQDQWLAFYDATKVFGQEHIFVACTGNHDYTWDPESHINDRSSTMITRFASFEKLRQNIVASYEPGSIENIIVRNVVRGRNLDIISLEFGPRPAVVDWAAGYVKAHPDNDFILLTHEWLNEDGKIIGERSFAWAQFRNTPFSSPLQVWENLVYDNDNVRCVVCGHNGFSSQLYTPNAAGRNVPQIMFNLQERPDGGDGLIQEWEFPQNSLGVKVRTIDTKTSLEYYESGSITSFYLDSLQRL